MRISDWSSDVCSSDLKPEIGTFGFDLTGMDKSVQPGDDFYAYANGTWAKNTEIPADSSNYGMFTALADLSQTRMREILDVAKGDPYSMIGRAYASYPDAAADRKNTREKSSHAFTSC